jgi:hypothetical protein
MTGTPNWRRTSRDILQKIQDGCGLACERTRAAKDKGGAPRLSRRRREEAEEVGEKPVVPFSLLFS